MTALDRTALRDALAPATPEMLKEDAEAMMLAMRYERPDSPAQPRIRRLAALALAVAEAYDNRDALSPAVVPDEHGLRQALHFTLAELVEGTA